MPSCTYVVCKLERVARDRQCLNRTEAAGDYGSTPANKKAEFSGSPAHPVQREEQELCYFKQGKELISLPSYRIAFLQVSVY